MLMRPGFCRPQNSGCKWRFNDRMRLQQGLEYTKAFARLVGWMALVRSNAVQELIKNVLVPTVRCCISREAPCWHRVFENWHGPRYMCGAALARVEIRNRANDAGRSAYGAGRNMSSMDAVRCITRREVDQNKKYAHSARIREEKNMLTLKSDLHGNHLLGALPAHEWQALTPHLELVQLRTGQLLCDSGQRIHHVYFPTTAIISLLHTMEDGGSVEIAAIGREGMTGVPVLTGGDTMPTRVQVQCPGFAYRMSASALREAFGRSDFLRRLMLLYMQALLTHVAQTAACNRHHC